MVMEIFDYFFKAIDYVFLAFEKIGTFLESLHEKGYGNYIIGVIILIGVILTLYVIFK